jgi:molybdopterin converting factor small subunit
MAPLATPGTLTVTVRYFAGAAAAAGTQEEAVHLPAGSTLADLISGRADARGAGLRRVLEASSYLVDAVHAVPADRLDDGATVDVLPPFAGG